MYLYLQLIDVTVALAVCYASNDNLFVLSSTIHTHAPPWTHTATYTARLADMDEAQMERGIGEAAKAQKVGLHNQSVC